MSYAPPGVVDLVFRFMHLGTHSDKTRDLPCTGQLPGSHNWTLAVPKQRHLLLDILRINTEPKRRDDRPFFNISQLTLC